MTIDNNELNVCVEELHCHLVTCEAAYNATAPEGTVYEFEASLDLIESSPDYQTTVIELRRIATDSGNLISQVKWKLAPEEILAMNVFRRDETEAQITKMIEARVAELRNIR